MSISLVKFLFSVFLQVQTLTDDLGREILRQWDWRCFCRIQDWRRNDRWWTSEEYNGGQEGRRGIILIISSCPHVVILNTKYHLEPEHVLTMCIHWTIFPSFVIQKWKCVSKSEPRNQIILQIKHLKIRIDQEMKPQCWNSLYMEWESSPNFLAFFLLTRKWWTRVPVWEMCIYEYFWLNFC